jgi:H+/Cl- antiporter ClcA
MIIKKAVLIISIFLLISINVATAYNSYEDSYYDENFVEDSSQDDLLILWVIIGLMLLFFLIWIGVSIWVYKDAKKRGEDSPIIWLLVTLFGGLVGLIVWLVVRPPIGGSQISSYHSYNRNRFCPICGRNIPFNATFCPYCNKKI